MWAHKDGSVLPIPFFMIIINVITSFFFIEVLDSNLRRCGGVVIAQD